MARSHTSTAARATSRLAVSAAIIRSSDGSGTSAITSSAPSSAHWATWTRWRIRPICRWVIGSWLPAAAIIAASTADRAMPR